MFFTIITFASLYIALGFFALCLATGLYYISELAEEYTSKTKITLRYLIATVFILHLLLLISGELPWKSCLFGAASHAFYFSLLGKFPYFKPLSVSFIGACICFIITHVVWYVHFIDPFNVPPSFHQLLGFFFTFVWICPMGLFVTLSFDAALPGAGNLGEERSKSSNIIKGHHINVFQWLRSVLFGKDISSTLPSSGWGKAL
eukprot:gb/GECH01004515.1/.p1 GENE.gb/GECH01004515.1/~~gb/GECH01004515.1/.p1  ORF type:complete len:203 (+),score=23.08 gb/GECH01004515.1/:1-609(+)